MSLAGPHWPRCRTLVVWPNIQAVYETGELLQTATHKIDPKDVIAGSVFSVSNSPATFRNPMHDDSAEQARERQAAHGRS